MKFRKSLISLSLLLVLAGCSGTGDDSTKATDKNTITEPSIDNSDKFSSGSTNPTPDTEPNPFNYTADDLYRLIKQAGDTNNFTFTYKVEDEDGIVSYDNIYTDDYIYFGYAEGGYLRVQDYKDSTSSLLYNFIKGDDGFQVENALAYNDGANQRVAIRSTREMNPLSDALKDKTASIFEAKSRAFYTEDSYLINALCYLRGITSLVGEIKGVELEVNKEFDEFINFRFAPNFSTTDGAAKVDAVGVCSISLIGNSEETPVKDFQASYSLPGDPLKESALSVLDGKVSLSARNTMHYTKDYLYEGYDIVTEGDKQLSRRFVSGLEGGTNTYYVKGSNGHAMEKYVGYDNKIHTDDTGVDFPEEVFQPKDTIEREAFRKTGENTYAYYGYDGRAFLTRLTKIDIGEVLSMTLTLDGGNISSLKAISTTRLDSYTQSMYFELDVDFKGTLDFTEPKTKSSEYSNAEMAQMLLYPEYSDLNASFQATVSIENSSSYPLSISVFASKDDGDIDTILYTQDYIDPAPGAYQEVLTKKWGYQKSGNEIIPFMVRDDNTTVSTSVSITDKSLKDLIGFDMKGCLFNPKAETKDGLEVYSLYSDVKYVSDHILGGDNKGDLIESSIRFMVDPNSFHPVSLEYEFNGLDLFKGKEKVQFSDFYATKKPSEIDFSTLKSYVIPDNWQDGAGEVYPTMVKILGDAIKTVPYLYNKEMAGNWGVDYNEDYKYVVVYNDTYAASEEKDDKSLAYMTEYEALLRKNGFTDCPYPMDQLPGLVKGELHVRVGERGMSGIRFMLGDDINSFDKTSESTSK